MSSQLRSSTRFVESPIAVKFWMAEPPPVAVTRPGQCPACEAAGAPLGGRVGLVGHGVRRRQQRGPRAPGCEPVVVELTLRRYRCMHCGAVVTTGPADLVRRRLFSGPAIALALALWSHAATPAPAVRRAVSPWHVVGAAAARGWASLRRWAQAAAVGGLWRSLVCATEPTLRARAGRITGFLAAQVVSSAAVVDRAFVGARLVR